MLNTRHVEIDLSSIQQVTLRHPLMQRVDQHIVNLASDRKVCYLHPCLRGYRSLYLSTLYVADM
jgi:hypothetical protein